MKENPEQNLSRRERQIMNVLYRNGRAAVTEIASGLPDAPTETSIRTLLRILQEKGHVQRERDGRRHLYRPTVSRKRAARAALTSVLETFFEGSLGEAVALHLADPSSTVEPEELKRLRQLVAKAKRERS